jgi:nucleotide-binding universal stress UspA family protein
MAEQPTLVVGVDFSPANRIALDAAIEAAKERHAKLALVHALQPLGAPGLVPSSPRADNERNETADVVSNVDNPLQRWEGHVVSAGVEVETISTAGQPADIIVDEAMRRNADAIVVGAHGKSAVESVVLGSTAKRVVERSPVPVLVVPDKKGERQHIVVPR